MNKISTNITLDPILKKKAVKLFNELGLDLSTAVGLFLKQAINENGLPFNVTLNKPNSETIKAIEKVEEKCKHNTHKSYELNEALEIIRNA